ncbi:MAG: 30S ribosomal protein S8 [Alphaproteobacteria bacterium]|nr:30S ribosomal protein S8 [Alphaproteobacteria bacterium]
MTDPISDTLARIRNAQMRRHAIVDCRNSKFIKEVLNVLKNEGYIDNVELKSDKGWPVLRVYLRYHGEKGTIHKIWRVSRPGRRVYSSILSLGKVADGWGTYILSTSKGVLSCRQARENGIGGEVVCAVL